jgi:hypothetical protein
VNGRQEFHTLIGAEQAFIAIVTDAKLRGRIAEQGHQPRAIHQPASIMDIVFRYSQVKFDGEK